MKSVRVRETQQERYRDVNATGVVVAITTYGTISNAATLLKYENIQFKGILNRGGKDHILFNETLKNLVSLSEWDSPMWEMMTGIASPVVLAGSYIAANSTFLIPLKFDFGGIINVDGSDELTIECRIGDASFNTAQLDETKCFIEFDIIEGVGLETTTPYIKSRTIEANQTNPTFDLGDNITEILIANYDKGIDMTTANSVLNNISVDSDKWSRNDSYAEMIARNHSQFTDFIQASFRGQSFRIYSGYELDNVKLNLNLNAANVAASKNFILYYCFETNDHTVTKAAVKHKKFFHMNNKKGQFQPHLAAQYK
jgi:hypothetical protein